MARSVDFLNGYMVTVNSTSEEKIVEGKNE